MKQKKWTTPLFIGLLILTSLACSIPFLDETSSVEPTPTPPGDTISFTVPAYTVGLAPGGFVPGTRLQYLERSGDGFSVSIDGLTAVKRTGDSFIWSGILGPGVFADYNLRLLTVLPTGNLQVAGPVTLTVLQPLPIERTDTTSLTAKLQFSNALINYYVPAGHTIPGTTVTYLGLRATDQTDQGGRQGEFSGTTGYPYLAAGDSLLWQGFLRNNTVVNYSFRTVSVSEDGVRFFGTADIWILP